MLLTRSQYKRFLREYDPRKSPVMRVGLIPPRGDRGTGPGWIKEMDRFEGQYCTLVEIQENAPIVTVEGKVVYEPTVVLEYAGSRYTFKLDWLDDITINDITRLNDPIDVNIPAKVERTQEVASGDVGWGVAAAGTLATILGMAYVNQRKLKKQRKAIKIMENSDSLDEDSLQELEIDVEVVEPVAQGA